jgi:AhpD family alkylhydroperoxidase
MHQRLDYFATSEKFLKKYLEFNNLVHAEPALKEFADLVTVRASQLNGCAFCLDMHIKEARIHGERELRLHHLAIWRESGLFTPRERAALAWTEALTRLDPQGVPDEIYAAVHAQLSEKEMSDLAFLIVTINGWNRLCVAFRTTPGSFDAAFGLDKAGLS